MNDPLVVELLETSEKFVAWLQSKEPDAVIGFRVDCRQCPIAMFLKANQVMHPQVSIAFITSGDECEFQTATPTWAAMFICRTDDTHTGPTGAVTSNEARASVDYIDRLR